MSNEEKSGSGEHDQNSASGRAVIFEFENIFLESRTAMFAILKESLSAYDKELTVPLFSRYCIYEQPEDFVPNLIKALGVSTRSNDKILKEFHEGMEAYWKSDDKACRPGIVDFLAYTRKEGFVLIAMTHLPEKLAGQVVQGLGDVAESFEIHSFADQDRLVVGADIWTQAALDREIDPGRCMGLASSSKACWAALSADLHCICVPDQYTAYEDFGGANRVYDSIADADVKDLIDTFYDNSDS